MDYKKAITWLYRFHRFGSQLGLERIQYLLEKLENPQNTYSTIHVTGTNGKGSVCRFIGSILEKAGYTVGVYVSPHLQRFSERMVINNQEISKDDIARLVQRVKPVVDKMIEKDNRPTFFEIVTAMAFQFFHDKSVDFAVVEVGLGGRYDATNVIIPAVSVITNVSLEHTSNLGKDVQSIAFEKAGIIKKNKPVITATVPHDARQVIKDVAEQHHASVTVITNQDWKRVSFDDTHQEFLIQGTLRDYQVQTSLLGSYQGENIALATAAIETLQISGVYIPDTSIIQGIHAACNPGRTEIISHKPVVLLDGAHNPAAMQMLKQTLQQDFEYNKLMLVVGILSDKNIEQMLSIIAPLSASIIVTKSHNRRACEPSQLAEILNKLRYTNPIVITDSLHQAIDQAQLLAGTHDLICITGSLFTVGEARSYLLTGSDRIDNDTC
jgi:dihydrofolate synthase/folylpolyglutamate synthase